MAGACLAAFAAGSPFTFLAAGRFLERASVLFGNVAAPKGTFGLWTALQDIAYNARLPLLLCAAVGLRGLLKEKSRPAGLAAAAAGLVVLFFGLWRAPLPHYTLLAYPVLCLFAADGAFRLAALHRALPAAAAASPARRRRRSCARFRGPTPARRRCPGSGRTCPPAAVS
jgi:hypothetical protein